MGASEGKNHCGQAREYYHDLVHGDRLVPPAIRGHVEGCPFCQEQIRRLGEALLGADDGARPAALGTDERTIEVLSLHFELLGERIRCARVRPFLPPLAAEPPIKVPTPVTVHVDRCRRCAEDLEAIRALHLGVEQLARLGRFYAASSGPDPADCRRARPALAAIASLAPENVEARVLDHVSTCSQCRAEVYRQRERLLDAGRREGWNGDGIPCTGLPAAELFDGAVPYGLAAATGKHNEAKAVLAHVRACPRCIEKMQALHRTIYGIAERAGSGVVTVCNLANGVESIPARYPVKVEILPGEPEPAVSDSRVSGAVEAMPRRRFSGPQRRPIGKIALVAAAAIVLAILWLPTSPTASGTHAGEILKALENAPNIHIAQFHLDATRIIHETWVARRLDLLLVKSDRQRTLYDFGRYRKTTLDPNRGPGAPVKLSEWEYRGARAYMASCVKSILTAISEDTRVGPVAGAAPGGAAQAIVYDKTWEDRTYGGRLSRYRWRVFIDPATSLPRRVEYFNTYPDREQWELTTIKVFEYPAEEDMNRVIQALFPER